MGWYYYIALAAIVSQAVFLVQVFRNYHFILSKYHRVKAYFQPRAVVIVPCKGLDLEFERNISSFFTLNYQDYRLWFVVEDHSDPAYDALLEIKERLKQGCNATEVRVFVAGKAEGCSQKNHNLLHCCNHFGEDIGVVAFADSDVCVRPDWLTQMVHPLRKPSTGVTSGYRWFVPERNNAATLALSAINAKIAQLLGNTRFNQAWGGSMAIRLETFRRLGIERIWRHCLSDDLSLSVTVKKAGLKVVFVPACLATSIAATDWRSLFEFGRRQFLITRVHAPKTWLFGLFSSLFSISGVWAGGALAVYAAVVDAPHMALYTAVPIMFLASQFGRALLRQRMIGKVLSEHRRQMKYAMYADIFLFWLWSLLLLLLIVSSAFGRTITWRGIKYKLLGPTKTVVITETTAP